MQVFVAQAEVAEVAKEIDAGLPESFEGWPVRYGWDDAEVAHRVGVSTLADWLRGELGVDPREPMSPIDWLLLPQQRLLGMVGGAVYADHADALRDVRAVLRWYPHDVWLWMIGCQWARIAQEEAFVGRAAEVGDGRGSRLLAARLVHEVMRLIFLLERTYWPYTKWFGTAFARLDGAAEIGPVLDRALDAGEQRAREDALGEAYELVARRHNARCGHRAGRPVDPELPRPAVPGADGRPLRRGVPRRSLRRDVARPAAGGSVDQFADSTDVLSAPGVVRRLRGIYQPD